MDVQHRIDTEVLVVGGGGAALFAAIKAKEAGAEVTLVDKGYAGYSGQSPYADGFLSFTGNAEDLEACKNYNGMRGEYVTNKDYVELVFKNCDARFNEMLEWGAEAFYDADGSLLKLGVDPSPGHNLKGMEMPAKVRKHALKIGVKFVDKVMVTDLLTKDGAVVGAVGMSAVEAEFYEFHAKAVILCTGASGLKSNGWPIHNLTGDGDAMAYRIGASIMGKEFPDGHSGMGATPYYLDSCNKYAGPKHVPGSAPAPNDPNRPKALNAAGEEVLNIGTLSLHSNYSIHEGKGPVIAPPRPGSAPGAGPAYEVGGVTAGMALHKAEGIVPKGVRGDTSIPGLFAAGDAMATMQNGSLYCPGGALAGSCVTGAESGTRAAEYCKEVEAMEPDPGVLEAAKEAIYAPLNRKGGYSPSWVIEQLQNLMFPYYITYIKSGERMEATLTMLKFFAEHLAPMVKANDPHELRLANEVRNMVLNSQMKLTMGLERKESRGMHYREDYPFRDDKNFLCWIAVKMDADGKMVTEKIDIPKRWLPENFDTMSYEEKYPIRILNETMQ